MIQQLSWVIASWQPVVEKCNNNSSTSGSQASRTLLNTKINMKVWGLYVDITYIQLYTVLFWDISNISNIITYIHISIKC